MSEISQILQMVGECDPLSIQPDHIVTEDNQIVTLEEIISHCNSSLEETTEILKILSDWCLPGNPVMSMWAEMLGIDDFFSASLLASSCEGIALRFNSVMGDYADYAFPVEELESLLAYS